MDPEQPTADQLRTALRAHPALLWDLLTNPPQIAGPWTAKYIVQTGNTEHLRSAPDGTAIVVVRIRMPKWAFYLTKLDGAVYVTEWEGSIYPTEEAAMKAADAWLRERGWVLV